MKKVAIETLGCKANQYDSILLEASLHLENFECVSSDESADIYIINSCTVTNKADQEAKHLLRRFRRKNPNAIMIMTGCYAQMGFKELEHIEGLHFVVGNTLKKTIVDILKNTQEKPLPEKPQIYVENAFKAPSELSQVPIHRDFKKSRFFLKIQDGCNDFCSFCLIPYARGKSRSLHPDAVISQIQLLVNEGLKEIVLTGISLGSYGADLSPKTTLAKLVKRIEQETDLLRLRISSLEPEDVNNELIEVLKDAPMFCPHFHLPLQSGDDEILRHMRRNYNVAKYEHLILNIIKHFKDVFIGTDIICGFPGEKEEQFQKTYDVLTSLPWSKLHIFPYSPRLGTAAATFSNQLHRSEILKRGKILRELSNDRHQNFLKNHLGKRMLALVEKPKNGYYEALTRNYISISFESDPEGIFHNKEISLTPFEMNGESLLARNEVSTQSLKGLR